MDYPSNNIDLYFLDIWERYNIYDAIHSINYLSLKFNFCFWSYINNNSNSSLIDSIFDIVRHHMKIGHSNISFSFTMKHILFISKFGFKKYTEKLLKGQ